MKGTSTVLKTSRVGDCPAEFLRFNPTGRVRDNDWNSATTNLVSNKSGLTQPVGFSPKIFILNRTRIVSNKSGLTQPVGNLQGLSGKG